jgi:hypothetical protein
MLSPHEDACEKNPYQSEAKQPFCLDLLASEPMSMPAAPDLSNIIRIFSAA